MWIREGITYLAVIPAFLKEVACRSPSSRYTYLRSLYLATITNHTMDPPPVVGGSLEDKADRGVGATIPQLLFIMTLHHFLPEESQILRATRRNVSSLYYYFRHFLDT